MEKPKKILIAEDDLNFISILKEKFEGEGFSVLTAQDGKEALRAAEKEKPDLIISDVLLPMLNGVDMAKQVREKMPAVPIIFLTNVKDDTYADIIKDIKNADYLIKSDIKIEDAVKSAKKLLGLIHS